MLLLHCAALNEAMSDIFGAPVEHERSSDTDGIGKLEKNLRLAPQGDACAT
jgi:hypothetical protein